MTETIDPELLEAFVEEVASLRPELASAYEAVETNMNQPPEYQKFSQLMSRIHSTAISLGMTEIGEYAGTIKNVTKKTGDSGVQRAMPEVRKMMKRCVESFDLFIDGVKDQSKMEQVQKMIKIERAKADKLDKEIFAYIK